MLNNCPECSHQVSDKAYACPNCGYPLRGNTNHTPKKRMRLPNGFGQISCIRTQKLRNPYRAMLTVGFTDDGKPIRKLLKPVSYFRTYNEAYAALLEYHKNPFDLSDDITVGELYARWSPDYFKSLKSASAIRTAKSAWSYAGELQNIRVRDIRARHLRTAIENAARDGKSASATVKTRMKYLFNLLFDYAVEYELAERNYARDFRLSENIMEQTLTPDKEHIAFTEDELNILWNKEDDIAAIMLIQCYMGWRPQELGLIRTADVDLRQNIITGGMKTKAGTDRIVPIHPRILPLIRRFYDANREYLFAEIALKGNGGSEILSYNRYRGLFAKAVSEYSLNPEHRAHDPRKTFVTMLKAAGADEYAIKYLAGHAIKDITERVYTERSLDWLRSELEKIR
ncbi:MAG: tyrosine-type recombinase/integrase [Schwartzia sp.]|nr:tyrosine-type recombinase/integrase [Schwartzia sp. (in: firmicutes)]